MSSHPPMYTTKDEADRHAQAIRNYWAAQGKYPDVRVEAFILPASLQRARTKTTYQVRSDMINGMPRD